MVIGSALDLVDHRSPNVHLCALTRERDINDLLEVGSNHLIFMILGRQVHFLLSLERDWGPDEGSRLLVLVDVISLLLPVLGLTPRPNMRHALRLEREITTSRRPHPSDLVKSLRSQRLIFEGMIP
jgi:hypothetical protein